MSSLLQQFKKRRLTLGLNQSDMMLRAGVSRQQYQRLESRGNPRLNTLELIAKGLNSSLMLIPEEKLGAVRAVLESEALYFENEASAPGDRPPEATIYFTTKSLIDDPWQGLLGDDQ
jgi:transcriptional regulator with XRE-family HTH domain